MRRSLSIHTKELLWRLFYNGLGLFLTWSVLVEDPYQMVFYYWLEPLKVFHIPLVQGEIGQLYENTVNFSLLTSIILISPLIGLSIFLFLKSGITRTESRRAFRIWMLSVLALSLLLILLTYLWPYLLSLVLDTPQVIRLLSLQIVYEAFRTFLIIPLSLLILGIMSHYVSRFVLWMLIIIIWGTVLDLWWEGPLILEACHLLYRICTKQPSFISFV